MDSKNKKHYYILNINLENDIIPVSGLKTIPDPNWCYISPSGKKHKWTNGDIPTLKKTITQVPELDYIFNGEDEMCIETGKSVDKEIYIDPETSQEVKPEYITIYEEEYIKGLEEISCDFGYNGDECCFEPEFLPSDCDFSKVGNYAEKYLLEKEGKFVTEFYTRNCCSEYIYTGRAMFVQNL